MHVIATAGHVDHGKSTLVRALTGMEPDRWAEEQRRGMTIDLGYAWTDLPSGARLAFVDVPGHQRFVSNMLAGVGPVPAAMVVIAADEGWRTQTEEHVAALEALGVAHGLVVVTRSDLADPAAAQAETRARLADSALAASEIVTVSGTTGQGLPQLRDALDRLVARLPASDRSAEPRLWIDRVFSIRGAGTVVTGTLATGQLAVGDEIEIAPRGVRAVVRGLQSCKQDFAGLAAVARVAVNLRGVRTEVLARGDALVAPGSTVAGSVVDAILTAPSRGGRLSLHLGSAAIDAHIRPLEAPASSYVRLTLNSALPMRVGDRGLLRDPGSHRIVAGIRVLDIEPPALRRRGAAAARANALAALGGVPTADDLVGWRELMPTAELRQLGLGAASGAVRQIGQWAISEPRWQTWHAQLDGLARNSDPGSHGQPRAALMQQLGLPDPAILDALLEAAGDLESSAGRVRVRGEAVSVAAAVETAVRGLEAHLRDHPFEAFDGEALDAAGIDGDALAAAVATGRLVRVSRDIYLLPDSVPLAVERLRQLPEAFTVSQARTAWHTSRRVAVPLLQHLDAAGQTVRLDETHRRLSR